MAGASSMLERWLAQQGSSCFHAEAEMKPQDMFPFEKLLSLPGVDKDGVTVREFDLKAEVAGSYFLLLFFPMDFTADQEELTSLVGQLKEFQFNECKLLAVSADSPYTTRSWLSKPPGQPNYIGGKPGYIFLSDKDQHLAHILGVSRRCGTPGRATFLVDFNGIIQYCSNQLPNLPRTPDHLLRLVRAFRHVDATCELIPVNWSRPGDEAIGHSHAEKLEYFQKKHGASGDSIGKVVAGKENQAPEGTSPTMGPDTQGIETHTDKTSPGTDKTPATAGKEQSSSTAGVTKTAIESGKERTSLAATEAKPAITPGKEKSSPAAEGSKTAINSGKEKLDAEVGKTALNSGKEKLAAEVGKTALNSGKEKLAAEVGKTALNSGKEKLAAEVGKTALNSGKEKLAAEVGKTALNSGKEKVAAEMGKTALNSRKEKLAAEVGKTALNSSKEKLAAEVGKTALNSDKEKLAAEVGKTALNSDKEKLAAQIGKTVVNSGKEKHAADVAKNPVSQKEKGSLAAEVGKTVSNSGKLASEGGKSVLSPVKDIKSAK